MMMKWHHRLPEAVRMFHLEKSSKEKRYVLDGEVVAIVEPQKWKPSTDSNNSDDCGSDGVFVFYCFYHLLLALKDMCQL